MDPIKKNNPILASIAAWAEEKSDMIQFAYNTKGGWEGWAQVELAARLYKDHGYKYGPNQQSKIVREVPIYTSSNRSAADIAIYKNGDPAQGALIFELKCESYKSTDKFKKNVLLDWEKVTGGLKPEFTSADIWVIGLAISNDANQAMENINPAFDEYQYPSGPVTIWWKQTEVRH
jgi:hypothetical protein